MRHFVIDVFANNDEEAKRARDEHAYKCVGHALSLIPKATEAIVITIPTITGMYSMMLVVNSNARIFLTLALARLWCLPLSIYPYVICYSLPLM